MIDNFTIPQIHPDDPANKDLPVYMQVPAQPEVPVAPEPIAVPTPPVKPILKVKHTHKKLKIALGVIFAFALLLFFLFFSVYNQSQKLMASARILKDSVATKNLDEVSKKLISFEKDYQSFSRAYSRI